MANQIKTQQLLEQLNTILKAREEIIFAYLFGSVAKGVANKLSDIDVAVYIDQDNLPQSGSFGYKAELILELEENLKNEVDVVILNEVPITLAFNIIKDGELIFCTSEQQRRRFHFQVLRDYHDFKPLIAVQDYYLKKQLKELNRYLKQLRKYETITVKELENDLEKLW